jgi:NTP pyrophosphatase (non-canonical NTP hydrolase)
MKSNAALNPIRASAMDVREYKRIAERTDQLEPKSPTHSNYKIMPILGLAGEIGSLLAEIKKRVREPNRATDFGSVKIKEELGDIVWYAATIARRANLDFQRDVLLANLVHALNSSGLYVPRPMRRKKGHVQLTTKAVESFNAYQRNTEKIARLNGSDTSLVPCLARIWKSSGELLSVVDAAKAAFNKAEQQKVVRSLGDVMWHVAGFATFYGLKLDDIMVANVEKTQSMFMPAKERKPTPLHDEDSKPLEQFPRRFNVDFIPVDGETSVMLINGMRVGDPLKDNAYQPNEATSGRIDGYRFHDCVHWAFVGVLGWSPVMRGLMKRKRKSNKQKDDAEDGARAQIVEEMIVKLAHTYAVNVDRDRLLNGRDHVDMDLLKQIKVLTTGLEVGANKLWEWEKTILFGFSIFHRLRYERQGRLTVDLKQRTVAFSKISVATASRFPNST